MFGPSSIVAVDLRGAALRLATHEHGTVRCWSVPAAATSRQGTDVLGQEAADLLRDDPGAGWDRLTLRIGDAVPVVLGGTPHRATDLVARILTSALPPDTERVILVAPPRWTPTLEQEFGDALARAGAPSVEVADHAAALRALSTGDPAGGILVINLGPEASTATLLDATGNRTTGQFPFQLTTDDLIDHTTEIARREAETAAGRRLTDQEARSLAACGEAAPERLPQAHRLDVQLPGMPAVRIGRAQLDRSVARVANSAAEGLLAALEAQGVALPRSVIVEGCGPSSPIISALSARFGGAVTSAPEAAVAVIEPLAEPPGPAVASGVEPHDSWAFPVPPPVNRAPLATPVTQEKPTAPEALLFTDSLLSATRAPLAGPAAEQTSAPEALLFSESASASLATRVPLAAPAAEQTSAPDPLPFTESPPARSEAGPGSLRRRGAAAAAAVLALAAVGVGAGPAMIASLRANSSAGNAAVALAQPAESPAASGLAPSPTTPTASPGPSASPTHTTATTKATTKVPAWTTPPLQATTTTTTAPAVAPSTTAPTPPPTTAAP